MVQSSRWAPRSRVLARSLDHGRSFFRRNEAEIRESGRASGLRNLGIRELLANELRGSARLPHWQDVFVFGLPTGPIACVRACLRSEQSLHNASNSRIVRHVQAMSGGKIKLESSGEFFSTAIAQKIN